MKRRTAYRQSPPKPPAPCLFLGPVRAIQDHKAGDIRIETTKDHPAGEGLILCRLAKNRMAEARAIVALPDLLRAAPPFVEFARGLAADDPRTPLFSAVELELEITTGQLQAMAAAYDRGIPPVEPGQVVPIPAKEPELVNKP